MDQATGQGAFTCFVFDVLAFKTIVVNCCRTLKSFRARKVVHVWLMNTLSGGRNSEGWESLGNDIKECRAIHLSLSVTNSWCWRMQYSHVTQV